MPSAVWVVLALLGLAQISSMYAPGFDLTSFAIFSGCVLALMAIVGMSGQKAEAQADAV